MENTEDTACKIACFAQQQTRDTLTAFLAETGMDCVIQEVADVAWLAEIAGTRAANYIVCEVNRKDKEFQSLEPFLGSLQEDYPPVLMITNARLYKMLCAKIDDAGHSNILVTVGGEDRLFSVLKSFLQGFRAGAEPLPPKQDAIALAENGSSYTPYENEERYRFLFNTCSDAVIAIEIDWQGKNGRLKEVNTIACKWLGGSPDMCAPVSLQDLFVFAGAGQEKAIIESLMTNQEAVFEAAIRGEAGAAIPVDVEAKNFPMDRGKFQVVLVARRKDPVVPSEEKKNSNEEYALVSMQAGLLMYEANLKTQQMIWGGEVEELTGFTPQELMRVGLKGWREQIVPEDYQRVITQINQAIRRLGKYHLEYRVLHKSGEIKTMEDHGAVLPDDSGVAERLLGTMSDITQRVQEQEQRLQLEMELQHSQRLESLGALAGGIAHDFNNILAGIIGLTDLAIREVSANSFVHEDLIEVLQAANRAKELVRQILAFSRQSGQEKTPIYLHIIAREVIKFLRASLSPTIEIIDSADVHSGVVMANAAQMYQIITNFTTNAAYAMRDKPGKIEVCIRDTDLNEGEVRRFPGLKPGPYVHLSVRDTGHGMSKSVLSRAFDPFYTTKGPGEGTGMGLAVVHGIVTDHGGAVCAESRLGVGSTFDVFLPRIAGVKVEEIEKRQDSQGAGERILFIDDDVAVLHFADLALPRLGFQVSLCMNGEEGLHVFQENKAHFDLVITDQVMPKMSGLDLAKKIHALAPQMPILLFTGFSDILLPETLADHGIKEVVYKPIVTSDLVEAIRRSVGKSSEAKPRN